MKNCTVCQNAKLHYAVLVDFVMDRLKSFEVSDIAIFKVCLLSMGVLLGGYYNKFVRKNAVLIAIIAIISYAYLIYKVFFKED